MRRAILKWEGDIAIVPDRLIELPFAPVRAEYGADDAVLYALGTGAGLDPEEPGHLRYLIGETQTVLPSFATVLGYESFWAARPETGIDVRSALQTSQTVTLHRALAPQGVILRETRIVGVSDKGAERGALVRVREDICDARDGGLIAELVSTVLCRADGGCGDAGEAFVRGEAMPDRPCDTGIVISTSPQQALVYRLSGDRHPLHVDPAYAHAAGFPRPILHGLSTYGAACRALIALLIEGEPERMTSIDARFTGIVFPGENLRLDIWRAEAGAARFRVTVTDRATVALDDGWFRWRA